MEGDLKLLAECLPRKECFVVSPHYKTSCGGLSEKILTRSGRPFFVRYSLQHKMLSNIFSCVIPLLPRQQSALRSLVSWNLEQHAVCQPTIECKVNYFGGSASPFMVEHDVSSHIIREKEKVAEPKNGLQSLIFMHVYGLLTWARAGIWFIEEQVQVIFSMFWPHGPVSPRAWNPSWKQEFHGDEVRNCLGPVWMFLFLSKSGASCVGHARAHGRVGSQGNSLNMGFILMPCPDHLDD